MAMGITAPLAMRLDVPLPKRGFPRVGNVTQRCVSVNAIRSRRRRTPADGGSDDDDGGKKKSAKKVPPEAAASGSEKDEEEEDPYGFVDSAHYDPPEAALGKADEGEDSLFLKNAGKAVNGVANGSRLFTKLKALSEKYSGPPKNHGKPLDGEGSEDVTETDDDVDVTTVNRVDNSDDDVDVTTVNNSDDDVDVRVKDTNEGGNNVNKDDTSFDLDLDRVAMEDNVIKEPRFKMTLSELLDEANVVPVTVEGDLEVMITGMQHDSRNVNPGDMFVCCTGMSVDGHEYAAQAAEHGAVVIVASKNVQVGDNVKAVVMVEDTTAILSSLAAAFFGHPSDNLAVVGITGTNGKTTTSYLLKSIYECMGLKTGLVGTIGYHIHGKHKQEAAYTTPDAIHLQKLMSTMVHNGTEICIMEVSSHGLAQGRCKEIDFDVAVFTNLSRDHMDYHKSEEEYKQSKGLLFAKMVDPGRHRKVVNIDDPNASFFVAQGNPKVPVITYGTTKDADVHPLDIQLTLFETDVLVRTPKGNIEISSGLLGRHNVSNILAAVAVGIAVDAPLEEIVRGIEEVDGVPGRVELVDEEQAFAVIVDYAHTPDALSRLLDTVRECGPKRIVTVVGCGGDRDRGKRPMMAKIAAEKSEVCIFTSDNPRTEDPLEILDDMLAGVGWSMEEYLLCGQRNYYPPIWNGKKVYVHDLRRIAIRAAVAMGKEGDAIVIAGKGHEKYQIIKDEKKFHDDREECREALLHLDMLHASGIDTSEIPWKIPGHNLG